MPYFIQNAMNRVSLQSALMLVEIIMITTIITMLIEQLVAAVEITEAQEIVLVILVNSHQT